ncbi:hypothetical protein BGW80DRAFT_1435409 [Lactifluus volemus]|nr:hypothetical protein BGW80DRAFT_1435409 [Lactifluus volemus]
MDQSLAKRTLQELIKRDDLNNKSCVDCGNPNPQWASLSFAVFICLQCAGIHRGFGVHISFVRSVSMDTWQEDQVRRMKIGGNGPFVAFIQAYTPAEQGGYKEGMSIMTSTILGLQLNTEKRSALFPEHPILSDPRVTLWSHQLDSDLQDKPWSPSAPPESFTSPRGGTATPGSRPSSAQGLRKSRASARTSASTTSRADSASPSLSPNPASPNMSDGKPNDQKAGNEAYFASLGSLNSTRPDDLPPSQGGRYQGSRAVPTLSELQDNPMGALSKGWSMFSSAVVGASRAVSENVIQPGVERVRDPTFHASVRGYVGEAGRRAGEVGSSVNQWGKAQLGVDVAGQLGGVVDTVRDRVGGGPARSGYDTVYSGGSHEEETSALYHDHEDDEDLFGEYHGTGKRQSDAARPPVGNLEGRAEPQKSSNGWDGDAGWEDF